MITSKRLQYDVKPPRSRPEIPTMPSRWLPALLMAALLAGAARAELLANGGFESGDLGGWTTFGPGWRTSAGGDAHAGSSYGLVNDVLDSQDPLTEQWRGIYQNVPVVAGETYLASAFISAVNVESSSSWLELQWLDSAGTVIRQEAGDPVAADQPFQLETLPWLVAPAGAVTASVRGIVFMAEPPATNADFHVFDDFSLIQIPAGALTNRSFETSGLDGWSTFGPGWRTGTGGDARSGIYGAVNDVLDSQDPLTEQWRGIYQLAHVSPATSYVASVYIRTLNLESSRAWLEVQWLNGDTQLIDQVQSLPVTNDQPFTQVQLADLQPPAEAVWAGVRAIVSMEAPPVEGADFHVFDDFSFLPQMPLEAASAENGELAIQWNEKGAGYLVESAADLAQPVWTRVHQAPTPTDNTWRVSIPVDEIQSYYRLTKP